MNIELSGFGKAYGKGGSGEFWAVRDFSLTARAGEFVTIVGPSGCGKSTVLNAIAGFVEDYEGQLRIGEVDVTGPGYERSLVFQAASLLPWRDVIGNVAYGMQLHGRLSKREMVDRTDWAIDLVGLNRFRHHYPNQLSGGMQQRVNLARALATRPQVLLMDEPFGALDAMTKERMQDQLVQITQHSRQSVIFITHDIAEAIYLGDRIVVMGTSPGRVVAVFDVPFPRPRLSGIQKTPEFQGLRSEIRELLTASEIAN